MSDINYVRRWEYDGREFASKADVVKYKATQTLGTYIHVDNFDDAKRSVDDLIAHADEIIALLKPFATPRPRKAKGNGAGKAAPKADQSQKAPEKVAKRLDTPATV